MAPVLVGEDDHLGVFLSQLAEVGIQGFDVVLALVDFFVEEGDLFVVGFDEFLALLYFLVQEVDFVKGHLSVLFCLFQQLVGGRDLFLQCVDFGLQLLFRLAFRFLAIGGVGDK